MDFVGKIIGLFTGGAGAAVGGAVSNVAAVVALAPVALWFLEHKDQTATCITWGQAALCGLVVFAVVKVAHWTRSPGQ